jgi:8-oxo-dGTP diphosphatase
VILRCDTEEGDAKMQGYNCIMVYSQDCKRLLFCKRTKDPYKGLYNLVGGKIEKNEDGYDAAYRELKEETGIDRSYIQLNHMMDFTYYNQNCYVEVYAGRLNAEITLYEEAHPLKWLDADENFFDGSRFAGEGNIGHMVEQVKIYGMGVKHPDTKENFQEAICSSITSIGVDGCKGGWIAAVLKQGRLIIDKYSSLNEVIQVYPNFDEFLIDMVIGLQSKKDHIRPDSYARKIINERTSTIFPAPCRQAVYAKTVSEAYDQNERVLGKKFTPLTVGIIPKMRELDSYFQENPEYKNFIKESHPEVCFARLNGKTVLSKKSEIDGMEERIRILSNYIPDLTLNKVAVHAKNLKCNIDDIVDAVCLAVTANIANQGDFDIIPENPMRDETGLLMQMIIPK